MRLPARVLAGILFSGLLLSGLACNKQGETTVSAFTPANSGMQAAVQDDDLISGGPPPFGNTAQNIERIRSTPYTGRFSFTFMGDNRNMHPFAGDGDKVYRKVLEKINQLRPTFAVNGGDFTFEGIPRHWQRFEEITRSIQVPYLTVIGNHDALFRRTYYEQRYTPPNPQTGLDDYSFEYGNTRFIAVDDANRTLTGAQYSWLHRQLTTPGVEHTIVMAHIPPNYGNWQSVINLTPADSTRFMDLLARDKASLTLLSHIHLFDGSVTYKGVPYVISGGAGAILDKASWGVGVYHVTLVTVEGPHITWRMVPVADHEGRPELMKQVR